MRTTTLVKAGKYFCSGVAPVARLAAVLVLTSAAWAQTENILYSFTGGGDGANPTGTLISDAGGNLYGTTSAGGYTGTSNCFGLGCGTVFELSPVAGGGWSETVLYTFTGGSDGAAPLAGLVFDASGNLYGTTAYGGLTTSPNCHPGDYSGCGVVFELSPSSGGGWTQKVIYKFRGGSDGLGTQAPVTFDQSGNLFGSTPRTGAGTACEGVGCGEVFELSPNGSGGWRYRVLHVFTGGKDGGQPIAGVTVDAAGNVFGTTYQGGEATGCATGCYGTAFELSPKAGGGFQMRVLHTFTGGKDGGQPYGSLTPDAAGNLYGTTFVGGSLANANCKTGKPYGCGVVYELSPQSGGSYKETALYDFTGVNGIQNPDSSVVLDAAGSLYGAGDGYFCILCSYVYTLSPSAGGGWSENTLFTFADGQGTGGGGAGRNGVLLDAHGNVYGAASLGGIPNDCPDDNGCGLIYQITP